MKNNSSNTERRRRSDVAHLREMVKQIDFCMLTTLDEQGWPHSRPMSTNSQVEFDGDLWFFIYGSSHKAAEIGREPKVNASFADPANQNWVSMTGTAEIVRDRKKIAELWQPQLKAWFPKGIDEPDLALLKVNVEKAEYWDSPSSTIAHVYALASSALTGQPANLGENKKIDMRGGGLQLSKQNNKGDFQESGARRRERKRATHREQAGVAPVLALLAGGLLGAATMFFSDPQHRENLRDRF